MYVARFLRLFCVHQCIYHVASFPGLWKEKFLKYENKVNVADMGFNPISTHKLTFGIRACMNVRLTFTEVHDRSKGYVHVDFGQMLNGNVSTYFTPSSKCILIYFCDPTDIIKHELACNDTQYFWLDWRSPGVLKLGKGLRFGDNKVLETEFGTTFNLNGLTVYANHIDGATLYMLFDDGPTFLSPGLVDNRHIVVDETDQIGVELFPLIAVDPEKDDVAFTVVGEHSDVFGISQNSLVNLVPLDYEKNDNYIVTIGATDQSHVVEMTLLVRLKDIDERPHVTTAHVEIPEELPVGSVILGGFVIEDKDKGDNLTLVLEGRNADYFEIDSRRSLIVKKRIDYESGLKSFTDIKLIAEDSAGLSTSAPLRISVVDMNDTTPDFIDDLYIVTIEENSTTDTVVVNLGNPNDELSVFIRNSQDVPMFTFDPVAMAIKVDGTRVDYEEGSIGLNYTLYLVATYAPSNGPLSSSLSLVLVNVLPKNEFDPYWTNPPVSTTRRFPVQTVSENITAGTLVCTFQAEDRDAGIDGQIMYSISALVSDAGESAMALFSIDEKTGEFTTVKQLDYDRATGGSHYYKVEVKAADMGTPSRSISAFVTIQLLNEDDNPPLFMQPLFIFDVDYDAATGTVVGSLSATDADGDDLIFNIIGSSTLVHIDASTSVMTLQDAPTRLDKEVVLQVKAYNGQRPNEMDESVVHISFNNNRSETIHAGITTTATTAPAKAGSSSKQSYRQSAVDDSGLVTAWVLCAVLGLALVAVVLNSLRIARFNKVDAADKMQNRGLEGELVYKSNNADELAYNDGLKDELMSRYDLDLGSMTLGSEMTEYACAPLSTTR